MKVVKSNKIFDARRALVVMIFFCIIAASLSAAGSDNTEVTGSYTWFNPLYNEKNIFGEQGRLSSVLSIVTVTTPEALEEEIALNMYDRNTEFIINYQGDTGDISALLSVILDEIFLDHYLRYSIESLHWIASGVVNNVDITFTISYLTTKSQEEYIDSEVERILSEITYPEMNDHQKLKAVHDYIVASVAYDQTHENRCAYSALYYGTTVCSGYTLLGCRMLEELDIECKYVTGFAGEPHAWNLVNLDGNWFHLDMTWNDPVPDVPGRVLYDYYNLSDIQMQSTHTWDAGDYPVAGTLYYQKLLLVIDEDPEEAHVYKKLMKGLDLHYTWSDYTASNIGDLEEIIKKSLKHKDPLCKVRTYQDVYDSFQLTDIWSYDSSLTGISHLTSEYGRTLEDDIILELYFTYDREVDSYTVNNDNLEMSPGQNFQLEITVFFSDSSSEDITSLARYEVWKDTIAVVTDTGLVTAISLGEAEIFISFGGIEDTVVVNVTDPPEIVYGDVNGDGMIDVDDAVKVLKHIVGLLNLDGEQVQAADVNGDGHVNLYDAILILRYLMGLIAEFPAEENPGV